MKLIIDRVAALALFFLIAFPGQAAVYRCESDDGAIAYSEKPCPGAGQSVEIISQSNAPEVSSEVCHSAQAFAKSLARKMQSGQTSIDVVNNLGGTSEVAAGIQSLINQVFSYRHNRSISAERIGYLIMARCKNGAFGQLGIGDFPRAFRTDMQHDEYPPPLRGSSQEFRSAPNDPLLLQQQRFYEIQRRQSREREERAVREIESMQQGRRQDQCERHRNRLDRLRERMRNGYSASTGERLRVEERQIRANIRRDCGD